MLTFHTWFYYTHTVQWTCLLFENMPDSFSYLFFPPPLYRCFRSQVTLRLRLLGANSTPWDSQPWKTRAPQQQLIYQWMEWTLQRWSSPLLSPRQGRHVSHIVTWSKWPNKLYIKPFLYEGFYYFTVRAAGVKHGAICFHKETTDYQWFLCSYKMKT